MRVNAIAPGPVDTPGAGGQLWAAAEAKARVVGLVPLGRFGAPEDVAHAALFLATAPYVTGACLAVDGGLRLGQARFLGPPP